ncbi:MAG: hypothetical protein ABIP54_02685 [Candidatus Andersenbacteria bacterium]
MPVILHMHSQVAGIGGDPWQTMWRFTVKGESGFVGFVSDLIGKGDPQLVNLSIWPYMPIHAVFGEPVGYNTMFLLNFLLSGYSMAILVAMLTRKNILSPAPLLAGIAYMFAPYHIAQSLGHFGAMQLQWIPFILATTLSCIRNQKIWKVVLLGLLFVVQAWEEHHYAVWLAIFGIIAGIVYWKRVFDFLPLYEGRRGGVASADTTPSPATGGMLPLIRRGENARTLTSITIFLLITFFGIILPYVPTLKLASQDNSALALGIDQTTRFSADIFSFITPAPFQPLWGNVFDSLFGKYFTGNESESVQYIGIGILIAILFFKKHVPILQKRLWFGAMIAFGLISLGPVLHIFGRITSIPLPYALLAQLPVFSAIRTISRAGVFVTFSACVLFGWVVATNYHRLKTSYIITGFLLLDFLFIPFPMQSAMLSPAYATIASLPGKNIIEIPAATNYVAASRSLYAETVTHKESLGNIALERGQSQDAFALIKSIPAIRQLLYLRTTELAQDRPELFAQDLRETLPDAMAYLNTDAILIHTDSISDNQKNAVEGFLDSMPAFTKQSFGDADVYTLQKNSSKTDGVFLIRGDGFENVGYDPKRLSTFAEVPHKATVEVVNMNNSLVTIKLEFSLAQESQGELTMMYDNSLVVNKALVLHPGVITVTLEHNGSGKAILQNPALNTADL